MDQVAQGMISESEILALRNHDRYLSLSEAIAYLSLSERTIRERLLEIRHYRVGVKLLFRKSELDKWMENHVEKSAGLDLGRLADEVIKDVLGPKK
jgi:excisionase family DNA binding protein